MDRDAYHVLFLCTGNSARSIMGEVIMNRLGAGRFKAYSAGSDPTGEINPFTIETLRGMGFPAAGLRSKSWDEFAAPGAPALDFVFTVCASAAGEVCPVWPGRTVIAHWSVDDPAAYCGPDDEKRQRFRAAALTLRRRIELFIALPLAELDAATLHRRAREIGAR